jgi:hypothetical protein
VDARSTARQIRAAFVAKLRTAAGFHQTVDYVNQLDPRPSGLEYNYTAELVGNGEWGEMTKGHKITSGRQLSVISKIITSSLTGGLTYLITNLTDQPQIWALTLTILVSGITLVVQFMSDFEHRLEHVEEKRKLHSTEIRSLIEDGFASTSEVTELFRAVEASALEAHTVIQLVRNSTQIPPNSPRLISGFAQSQIGKLSQFLKELSEGGEVCYDGEDRDWLLGLTMQSEHTIDATSLSTVDAGSNGFNGGLWTSEHGQRYLAVQRDAMRRGVVVRRLFILDSPGQARELDFLRIYRQQQKLGIHTRVLDRSTIPHALKNLLFDFVVFDGVVSYEVTPASRVEDTMKPTIVKTHLALQDERVKERMRRFEDLWISAQEFEFGYTDECA